MKKNYKLKKRIYNKKNLKGSKKRKRCIIGGASGTHKEPRKSISVRSNEGNSPRRSSKRSGSGRDNEGGGGGKSPRRSSSGSNNEKNTGKLTNENIIELKNCYNKTHKFYKTHKFCNVSILKGVCIPKKENCSNYNGKNLKQPPLTKLILKLEGLKKTIEGDIYKKSNIKERSKIIIPSKKDLKKKKPTSSDAYLVLMDIKELAKIPIIEPMTNTPSNSIFLFNDNDIEFLGWLLLGLKNLTHMSSESFLHYFMNKGDYKLTNFPKIQYTNGKMTILDGRHRLGFYNYFDINVPCYISRSTKIAFETSDNNPILHNYTPPPPPRSQMPLKKSVDPKIMEIIEEKYNKIIGKKKPTKELRKIFLTNFENIVIKTKARNYYTEQEKLFV